MARLDALLARGLAAARETYGPDAATDPFRGLYVTPHQAQQALDGSAGRPLVAGETVPVHPDWAHITREEPGWSWLRRTYPLTDLDLDVVLIALGPEVDRRYERLYGYLQDDVSRRRPTINLALDLLTTTVEERLAARGRFGTGAPLTRHRVLRLLGDPREPSPPLLAHLLVPDEQIVDIVLHQHTDLDRRVTPYGRLTPPCPADGAEVSLTPRDHRALVRTVTEAWGRHPLRLYFSGPAGAGQQAVAGSLATAVGAPLLEIHLDRLPAEDGSDVVPLVLREASVHGALLHLRELDALRSDQYRSCREALAEHLSRFGGVVILSGTAAWAPLGPEPLGPLEISFARSDAGSRRGVWARTLARHGAGGIAPDVVDALADRFRLGPAEIDDAVLSAVTAARWRASADGHGSAQSVVVAGPTRDELFAAARRQTRHGLSALARRIEPAYGWDDIVLPSDATTALHEICSRVAHRRRVMEDWGFERTLSQGRGINALFAGPPGTGKTMAAEVIARELGLDLFKIDLSGVVDKYIGETEKNLERLFTAATDANAILFFDEADALFGKRSDVRDSHDRYANIEIAYLLQRMEQYDGLAVLATNLRQHLDDAFTRRLQFVVEFPLPDEAERQRIWERCLPAGVPRSPDIDLGRLSRRFRLSGGNITNVVLGAAFLAAAHGAPISMSHLLAAIRREHQKLGRVDSEIDLLADGDD